MRTLTVIAGTLMILGSASPAAFAQGAQQIDGEFAAASSPAIAEKMITDPVNLANATNSMNRLIITPPSEASGYAESEMKKISWATEESIEMLGIGVTVGTNCDVRDVIIVRDSGGSAHADNQGRKCQISGAVKDAYTGEAIETPTKAQVDHIVPRRNAWDSGAYRWDVTTQKAFKNDPVNLATMAADENGEKSDSTIDKWQPEGQVCLYAERYAMVKDHYHLSATIQEKNKISEILRGQCGSGESVEQNVAPSPVVSAQNSAPVADESTGVSDVDTGGDVEHSWVSRVVSVVFR